MNDFFNIFFAAGDAPFFFAEQIRLFSWLPETWNGLHGMGMQVLFRMWYDYPLQLIIKIASSFGFGWWMIDKIVWLGGFFLSTLSMYVLSRNLFQKNVWRLVSALVYATNTYALMMFGGGQLGVYWGYAILPLFLHIWIFGKTSKLIMKTGLITSALVAADLRIGIIGGMMLILFFVWKLFFNHHPGSYKRYASEVLIKCVSVVVITVLLHMYWILPSVITRGAFSGVGEDLTGVGMVKYLSFADFTHSMSLLHPNWPENLFGFIHFMRPEFLGIPLLAFMSVGMTKDKNVFFFLLAGLVGAFLAKGTNEPFGFVYEWLFAHVPGFVLFRDPTKFYSLVALSYALAIPFSLDTLLKKIVIKRAAKLKLVTVVIVCFLMYWGILDRELLLGKLTGNFSPPSLPRDYVSYKNMLISDQEFGRVLWVPEYDRFAYGSVVHPFVDANSLIKDSSPSSLITTATSSAFLTKIRGMGFKYIAIATDEARKLYIDNYKFVPQIREMYIQAFDATGLPRVLGFESLRIYTVVPSQSLFSDSAGNMLHYQMLQSTKYLVTFTTEKNVKFLMAYDPHWQLVAEGKKFSAVRTDDGFMSFSFPHEQFASGVIQYLPQQYADVGASISGVSLALMSVILLLL